MIFKAGDLVRLKSGGPIMTCLVFREAQCPSFWMVPAPDGYLCQWFDHQGVGHKDWFRPFSLVAA